jgi:hypothetical protein
MATTFKHGARMSWETYATVSHIDPLSISVSADNGQGKPVRIGFTSETTASVFKLTAERARELAAELLAAADSLNTIKEAA